MVPKINTLKTCDKRITEIVSELVGVYLYYVLELIITIHSVEM